MIKIVVQHDDFDVGAEIGIASQTGALIGALVTFTGVVRGESEGEPLLALVLEHYPAMTERELKKIAEEASRRWILQAVTIVHRIGRLVPGEQIVLVLTASSHRAAAFEAAQFLMDYLKTRAPFWKKEIRASGEFWVDARDSDDAAAAQWTKA